MQGNSNRKQLQQAGLMRRSQMQQRLKAAPYQIQYIPTCQFCKKRGHIPEHCHRRLGLCLACGSSQHRAKGCSKRRDITKLVERPALPEPRVSHPEDRVDHLSAPGEYQSRPPLPAQASQFAQARKQEAKQRREQAFSMTSSFQHPSVPVEVLQPAS